MQYETTVKDDIAVAKRIMEVVWIYLLLRWNLYVLSLAPPISINL